MPTMTATQHLIDEEFPPSMLASPMMQTLTEAASAAVGFDNDLYPLAKEEAEDAHHQKIVNVLSPQYHTVPAAIAAA